MDGAPFSLATCAPAVVVVFTLALSVPLVVFFLRLQHREAERKRA